MVMGIESDGGVKGCPSLQSLSYVGGSLRDRTLADVWQNTPELAFNRARGVDDLWGFCRTCDFAACGRPEGRCPAQVTAEKAFAT